MRSLALNHQAMRQEFTVFNDPRKFFLFRPGTLIGKWTCLILTTLKIRVIGTYWLSPYDASRTEAVREIVLHELTSFLCEEAGDDYSEEITFFQVYHYLAGDIKRGPNGRPNRNPFVIKVWRGGGGGVDSLLNLFVVKL